MIVLINIILQIIFNNYLILIYYIIFCDYCEISYVNATKKINFINCIRNNIPSFLELKKKKKQLFHSWNVIIFLIFIKYYFNVIIIYF